MADSTGHAGHEQAEHGQADHQHGQHEHDQHEHGEHEHGEHEHGEHEHGEHGQGEHGQDGQDGRALWRMAVQATLHCLTGCAVGEVLGMMIGTALGWSAASTVVLAVVLAFVFGYALTMRPLLRSGVDVRTAMKLALAADTVSIAVMEVIDNAVMLAVPGAMEAGPTNPVFWASLVFALAVAFALTVPVNRWLITRGRGHAVVHRHHR